MVNANMRSYNYFTYGDSDAYGQPQLSEEVQGTIKMAIYTTSQYVQDNINYKGASYVGMTHGEANDKMVIQYGDEKLKVLYVNPMGVWKQVYMGAM